MSEWIAIVSILVSGAVGLAGVRAAIVTSREGREHSERMAREEREHTERLARTAKIDDQAREAARKIHSLMEELRVTFDGIHSSRVGDGIELEDDPHELSRQLDAETVLLPPADLRSRLESLALSVWWSNQGLAVGFGHSLQEVGGFLARAGHELIGSYLRGEPLPAVDSSVYQKRLEEYARWAMEQEDEIRDEADLRSNSSD